MSVHVDICMKSFHLVYIDVYVQFMLMCFLCLYPNLDVYHFVLFMCSLCFMCMCMRMFMLSVTFMSVNLGLVVGVVV